MYFLTSFLKVKCLSFPILKCTRNNYPPPFFLRFTGDFFSKENLKFLAGD